MALSRADADAFDDVRTAVVEDVWGGDVRVRSLSLRAQSRFASVSAQFAPAEGGGSTLEDLHVALLADCVIDDTGKRWFTGEDDARKFLSDRNPDDVEKIADAISELSGLRRKPGEAAEGFGTAQIRRFRFRLAAHLGMTVEELEDRMTAREFDDWAAYESVCGRLGPERLDDLFAVQTMHLVGLQLDRQKARRLKHTQFGIRWDRPTVTDVNAALLSWAQAHNERISHVAA